MGNEKLTMCLFCFYSRKDGRIVPPPNVEAIRNTFYDYDWDPGFAVEEVVVDDILANKLVIQFVSRKDFILDDNEDLDYNLYSKVVGKEQFISNIFSQLLSEESDVPSPKGIEGYFCFLGEAGSERAQGSEKIYKIVFSKYGELIESDMSLDTLLKLA